MRFCSFDVGVQAEEDNGAPVIPLPDPSASEGEDTSDDEVDERGEDDGDDDHGDGPAVDAAAADAAAADAAAHGGAGNASDHDSEETMRLSFPSPSESDASLASTQNSLDSTLWERNDPLGKMSISKNKKSGVEKAPICPSSFDESDDDHDDAESESGESDSDADAGGVRPSSSSKGDTSMPNFAMDVPPLPDSDDEYITPAKRHAPVPTGPESSEKLAKKSKVSEPSLAEKDNATADTRLVLGMVWSGVGREVYTVWGKDVLMSYACHLYPMYPIALCALRRVNQIPPNTACHAGNIGISVGHDWD